MTSTTSIVTILNAIAASLGHAGALSDEQLACVDTLAAWRDVFDQNVTESAELAREAGHGWSAPQAVWLPFERLDEAPRGLMHTTQTGRLTVMVDQANPPDWDLAFDFEAGPLRGDTEGRPVLSVRWTCRDGRVSCSVSDLDTVLIAEKPSRIALLMQLANAAGFPADDRLRYAIDVAEAHAVARASLLERSVARLASVDVVPADLPVEVGCNGRSWSPEDFAPAAV
jgi:hypothetical protein